MKELLFVVKLPASSFAIEFPGDLDAIAVHPAIPGATLTAKRLEVWDSPITETLPREEADFDLRLIEPTSMCWGVVNGEAVPNFGSPFLCRRHR